MQRRPPSPNSSPLPEAAIVASGFVARSFPMAARIQCNHCAEYFPNNREGAVHLGSCRKYNGWTNYETWLLALWFDNEPSSYAYWREVADELACDEAVPVSYDDSRPATYRLANRMRLEIEAAAEVRLGEHADVFSDLLSAALSEIAWLEIADHVLDGK